MKQRRWYKAVVQGAIVALVTMGCDAHAQNANAHVTLQEVFVIGFVGGFVKHDDAKHAEVQFAARLHDRYHSAMQVTIFQNHDRARALRYLLQQLDTDHDGSLSPAEKAHARIVIFGHSWGASETVTLARNLQQQAIPVLLTIQVDTITKPGEETMMIPPNVGNAVNFYQTSGLLHGRSEIRAAVPARTHIVGNFLMTYKNHPVDCSGFPWYARFFTRPHIEIENDPRVWQRVASLIEGRMSALNNVSP